MKNFLKNNWFKVITVILSILLIILLTIVIVRLLGYKYNKIFIKEFLSYDRSQCVESEYLTYYNHSGIQGCVFWMREDYLQKTQHWRESFKEDDNYCEQKYSNNSTFPVLFGALSDKGNDPKCEYEAFRKQKRNENWNYLVSKEEDGFYNYCIEQICPRPKMFE